MSTFYCDKNGKILELGSKIIDEPIIKKGDFVTCEYRIFNIVSKNFDFFGKSELMVVNYVKTSAQKESALKSITYYDRDVKPYKINTSKTSKKQIRIGPFDSSEYGNPVCYYTSGYMGNTINITTKIWEIDDSGPIKKIVNITGNLIGLIPSNPYIDIASAGFSVGSRILVGSIRHNKLTSDHVLEFRIDREDQPFYSGKYICFPDVITLADKKRIISDYIVVDNTLIKHLDNNEIIEYEGSYFILDVTTNYREELLDYDFSSSSVELLKLLDSGISPQVIELQKDSYNLKLLDKLTNDFLDFKNGEISDDDLFASYKRFSYSKIGNMIPHLPLTELHEKFHDRIIPR